MRCAQGTATPLKTGNRNWPFPGTSGTRRGTSPGVGTASSRTAAPPRSPPATSSQYTQCAARSPCPCRNQTHSIFTQILSFLSLLQLQSSCQRNLHSITKKMRNEKTLENDSVWFLLVSAVALLLQHQHNFSLPLDNSVSVNKGTEASSCFHTNVSRAVHIFVVLTHTPKQNIATTRITKIVKNHFVLYLELGRPLFLLHCYFLWKNCCSSLHLLSVARNESPVLYFLLPSWGTTDASN